MNTRPADYESAALPTELFQHILHKIRREYYITIFPCPCQSFQGPLLLKMTKGQSLALTLAIASEPFGLLVLLLALIFLLMLVLAGLRLGLRIGILISGLHVLSIALVLHYAHLAFAALSVPRQAGIIRKNFCTGIPSVLFLWYNLNKSTYIGKEIHYEMSLLCPPGKQGR